MDAPDLYSYNDFRKYLADWQAHRQSLDPDFSKSEVSRQLGLPRTRSFFTDVLAGRKVSGAFVDRFLEILALDREETRYFRTLVRFNQAETPEDRELAFDQLVGMTRVRRTELEQASYDYYRHWWNGAIRALLATGDFTEDPAPIARRLRPAVTPGQVRDSVALLLRTGLVERDASGFLRPVERHLATPERSRDELVKQLQIQQLGVVQTSLMAGDDADRRVFTNTVSISESGAALLLERADNFRRAVATIVQQDPDPLDRVLQITLSLVPVARKASP